MMKLLICLIGVCITCFFVYWLLSFTTNGVKKKQKKQVHTIVLVATGFVGLILTAFVVSCTLRIPSRDLYCQTSHTPITIPPKRMQTAMDYFILANYEYERGDCDRAIEDYTRSIQLNPGYAQAYNNRAYTYMRLQRYDPALKDLDVAIELKPNYTQALMNRGDIRNYYWALDKGSAINDYVTAVAYRKPSDRNICGHLFLARHNGWSLRTLLALPWEYVTGLWCR